MIEQFKIDVDENLSNNPKTLPSKYFYDQIGDELFVKIMGLPEYYLTRAEFEIFSEQTQEIIDALEISKDNYFELIELGAGDGLKTKELLKKLEVDSYRYDFFPVDISKDSLNQLENSLAKELPDLKVKKQHGDYFQILESLKDTHHKKIVLFLGSNIGNLSDELAAEFVYKLGSNLSPGDKLLLGVDLIKSEDIVLPAYNDNEGITSKFNLNLLNRINRELGGDFDTRKFIHTPEYSEEEGVAKSYLQSTHNQTVNIKEIGKSFSFKEGEKIHTEISRKYNDEIISNVFKNTDFQLNKKLTDSKNYFADYIFERL